MDFMTKLERKFGKYSIPNLTVFLILGFVVGYLIEIFAADLLHLLTLDPSKIMQGQVYRLITWILIPPSGVSVFVIITLFFYYSIGRTLERTLGDFRYTVYMVSGVIFTDLGLMIAYFVMKMMNQEQYFAYFYQYGMYGASTYYLCMSMFLAYAFMFPDHQVLMYFIIPIRIKWLGYLDIVYLIVEVLRYGMMGYYAGMVTVLMSVLNFIIFYIASKGRGKGFGNSKRRRKYRQEVRQSQILTRHKCAICGQTEEDNPELEFRYCSRCVGNYEYCQNHLFTHEHKK